MAEISASKLMRAMSAVAQLKEQLAGYSEDDILASIESETNALELMDRIIEHIVADEALVESGKARLKRIEARSDRYRSILRAMMEEIGEKVERPVATLSLSNGPRPVEVIDQSLIPPAYWRRAVDKIELGKHLRAGEDIPGAMLGNGAPVLKLLTR